jgi:hypothetical protein
MGEWTMKRVVEGGRDDGVEGMRRVGECGG